MNPRDSALFAKFFEPMRVAMLTTRHADTGAFRSRPMVVCKLEPDGTFWFFTGAHAPAATDIRGDARVGLAFASGDTFLSVTGVADLVHDRGKFTELWSPSFATWFPAGFEDPELMLIRLRAEAADYWESPSGPAGRIAGFARALGGGGRFRPTGERGHLDLGPPWH